MIISHRHRFVFVAIPKTGTHSVRQALRTILGPDDLEQVGLFVRKRFPFPELANVPHGHISAAQIRPVLGEETFAGYFKFAFVRNPFDRFVSYCAFVSRDTGDFERAPLAFMKYVIRELRPFDHILFRPQCEFLVDANGTLLMDYVGRTEEMQASYDTICARLGVASTPLERVNASSHRPYAAYYDEELVAMVAQLYRDDLALFNYRFDPHARQSAQDQSRQIPRSG
ncbi:sulfotransferase family 2 domain-containing protein [Dokdonella ginsengisoli]|uniref:Sulfotransferase family 2 domain-containing protein n=1 Tax=Dokdonella ginsengisoli TaxID=363846 RepID=A0ABV9QWJ6_9GAMM